MPAANPYQIVPASTVVNVNTSIPELVNVGSVPPAQSTVVGQVTSCDPPLVSIKVNEHDLPVADGLEKVNVFADVSTVALTTLPAVRSMSCVPPPVAPIALTVSA